MKCLLLIACCRIFLVSGQTFTTADFKADFHYLWNAVQTDYCYLADKQTDWQQVKIIYGKRVDTITTLPSFVALLESVLRELYDHHASLSTNTRSSYQLVPSGTNLWGEYLDGKYWITEVKPGSPAAVAGFRPGMKVTAINGLPIDSAVNMLMPKCMRNRDSEAISVTFRLLLAGTHQQKPKITVLSGNSSRHFQEHGNSKEKQSDQPWIESAILDNNIGFIRINNRLWDNGIIPVFDSVLRSLNETNALILDLRQTPSGGNTTVARAILGSFIPREAYYQKHELSGEERQFGIRRSWMEIVSPRSFLYSKPMAVLANHWTGSVGEGITIGFHANKRAVIVGTTLARLNGAIYSYRLPRTSIGFVIPTEKLFHVNGSPRENFNPDVLVDVSKAIDGRDIILESALQVLKRKQ